MKPEHIYWKAWGPRNWNLSRSSAWSIQWFPGTARVSHIWKYSCVCVSVKEGERLQAKMETWMVSEEYTRLFFKIVFFNPSNKFPFTQAAFLENIPIDTNSVIENVSLHINCIQVTWLSVWAAFLKISPHTRAAFLKICLSPQAAFSKIHLKHFRTACVYMNSVFKNISIHALL